MQLPARFALEKAGKPVRFEGNVTQRACPDKRLQHGKWLGCNVSALLGYISSAISARRYGPVQQPGVMSMVETPSHHVAGAMLYVCVPTELTLLVLKRAVLRGRLWTCFSPILTSVVSILSLSRLHHGLRRVKTAPAALAAFT